MFLLLWVYFFVIALYNPVTAGFNLSNFVLFLGLLVLLIFKNGSLKLLSYKRINVFLLYGFYIYLSITLLYSVDKHSSITIFIKLIIPYMFSILLLNTIKTQKHFLMFINILMYSGAAAAIYGCIQYFFGLSNYVLQAVNGTFIYRSVGAFNLANVFASFLAMLIPFMVYKVKITENKFVKSLDLILVATSVISLYLTYSRWAIICLIISFLLYGIKHFIRRITTNRIPIYKITIFFPIVVGLIMYIFNKYSDTINALFFDRGSNDVRQSSLTLVLQNFKPWGLGLGNGNEGIIVDSNYVMVLIDTGVIGLSLFLLLILTFYISLRRRSEGSVSLGNIYIIAGISLMVFIFNGVLETPLYNSVINIFLGIYIYILNADKDIFVKKNTISTEVEPKVKRKRKKIYKLTW
ncbi:O-antigen ligase family protein [Priestia megaterium]|uniref:O-antigen ligase family protein n=1 Tax=Priestia megaterium TaxID=1404 RepID=UPI0016499563|nr:hypothetical protein [Priestia megaterium]